MVIPEDEAYIQKDNGSAKDFLQSIIAFFCTRFKTPALINMRIISTTSQQSLKQSTNRLEIRTYKSATVLISVVILFLFTHIYRIALKIFEVSTPNTNTMETFMACFAKNR